jgi:hypothetical protein
VLDGIKQTQRGIPDYFRDNSSIFYGRSIDKRAKSTIRIKESPIFPKIGSAPNDNSKNTISKKTGFKKARKELVKDIIIRNNSTAQERGHNKSALMKKHSIGVSYFIFLYQEPGAIPKREFKKIVQNPYLKNNDDTFPVGNINGGNLKLPSIASKNFISKLVTILKYISISRKSKAEGKD